MTRSVIFNRVRDLTAEIISGHHSAEIHARNSGVDRALAFSEINQQLYQLLNGLDVVYHAQGEYAYADEIVNSALEKLRKGSRQNLTAPATMIDWRPVVHEMRLFKSPKRLPYSAAREKSPPWHIHGDGKMPSGNVRVPSGRRNSPRI